MYSYILYIHINGWLIYYVISVISVYIFQVHNDTFLFNDFIHIHTYVVHTFLFNDFIHIHTYVVYVYTYIYNM